MIPHFSERHSQNQCLQGQWGQIHPGLVAYPASPDAPSTKACRQVNKHCSPPHGQHLTDVRSGSEPAKEGEETNKDLKLKKKHNKLSVVFLAQQKGRFPPIFAKSTCEAQWYEVSVFHFLVFHAGFA